MATEWRNETTGQVVGVVSARGQANGGGTRWTWVGEHAAGRTAVVSECGERSRVAWVVGQTVEQVDQPEVTTTVEEWVRERWGATVVVGPWNHQ